jgi:virginiamycin B lyase
MRRCTRPGVEAVEPRQLLSTITELPLPPFGNSQTSFSNPEFITPGPDGNLWFSDSSGIGVVNAFTHAITTFVLPNGARGPASITSGPDGDIWFTEQAGVCCPPPTAIGMINPKTDAISEFLLPYPNAFPNFITTGPDGNLWFTDTSANLIGRFNPSTDAFTEYPIPTQVSLGWNGNSSYPTGITAGPDGNIWFTEMTAGKIGMINPTTGAIREFSLPDSQSEPTVITSGPNGNLWFTEWMSTNLGEINPTTGAITEIPLKTPGAEPGSIVTGADGNVYFTLYFGGSGDSAIGMINPATLVVTETPTPTQASGATGIAVGADGKIWFTETSNASLGILAPSLTPSLTLSDSVLFAGTGVHRHVLGFELDFSSPLDPRTASKSKNYVLTQLVKKGDRVIAQSLPIKVRYNSKTDRVDVLLKQAAAFSDGGKLRVGLQPLGKSTHALLGKTESLDRVAATIHLTFVIGHKGKTISP